MAVEADNIGLNVMGFAELGHRIGVPKGQIPLQRAQIAGALIALGDGHRRFQSGAQAGALGGGIGESHGGAAFHHGFAIGADECGIDAIERSAAHQAQCIHEVCHGFFPW